VEHGLFVAKDMVQVEEVHTWDAERGWSPSRDRPRCCQCRDRNVPNSRSGCPRCGLTLEGYESTGTDVASGRWLPVRKRSPLRFRKVASLKDGEADSTCSSVSTIFVNTCA
jgi:hypothetical protein